MIRFLPALTAGILVVPLLLSISCITIQEPVIQRYTETIYVSDNESRPYSETIPSIHRVTREEPLIPYILWSNPSLKFSGHMYLWYHGYNLSNLQQNSGGKLKILLHEQKYYEKTVLRAFDMTPRGQILTPPQISPSDPPVPPQVFWTWISVDGDTTSMENWLNLANIKLNHARFLGARANLWSHESLGQTLELDVRGAREIAIIMSGPTIPQNARFTTSFGWTQSISENQTVTGQRPLPSPREITVEKERTVFKARQAPFWELFFK